MEEFEFTWFVSDGYVGGGRPQTSWIDFSDFEGLDREQAKDLLEEIIQGSFESRISPHWRDDEFKKFLAALDKYKQEKNDEGKG